MLTDIIANVGDFVEAAVGWMGQFATVVSTNAIIFVFVVAVPLVGLGVSLLRRLFAIN